MMTYNIGQVIKMLEVNKETLRYYEKIGLLKDIKRDGNGYRMYTDNDIEVLQFILMAKEYDFTLKEIELLINKVFPKDEKLNYGELTKVIDDKMEEIDQKIEELANIKKVLVKVKNNVLIHQNTCYKGKTKEEILNM